MMIGVPYNPILGEMSVDSGDAACHGGAVARRLHTGQSAPDPAGKVDKILSFVAPSRTARTVSRGTRAQSPPAATSLPSRHADSSGPDIDLTTGAAKTVGVIFRHAVRPSFYTVPAPAIVLSDGCGHEAARTPSAVVHPG